MNGIHLIPASSIRLWHSEGGPIIVLTTKQFAFFPTWQGCMHRTSSNFMGMKTLRRHMQMPRFLSSASFWAKWNMIMRVKQMNCFFRWYDFWRNLGGIFASNSGMVWSESCGFLWFSQLQSWPGESHAFTSEAWGAWGKGGGFFVATHVFCEFFCFFRVNQPFMWEMVGW